MWLMKQAQPYQEAFPTTNHFYHEFLFIAKRKKDMIPLQHRKSIHPIHKLPSCLYYSMDATSSLSFLFRPFLFFFVLAINSGESRNQNADKLKSVLPAYISFLCVPAWECSEFVEFFFLFFLSLSS